MQMLPPASALGHRYFPHVVEICERLAQVGARHRLLSPLMVLVWCRLRRALLRLDRLDRLAARCRQGRLRPPRRRIRPPAPPRPIHPADAWRPRRTPRGHAWLIRLHQPLAQFAPRIEMLLADPDIAALCQAAPQAGRLLRPLARMFGLTPPPHMALPPAPPRPRRQPAPAKPRPPPFAEHSPLVWPFVPLRLRLRVPGLLRRSRPA